MNATEHHWWLFSVDLGDGMMPYSVTMPRWGNEDNSSKWHFVSNIWNLFMYMSIAWWQGNNQISITLKSYIDVWFCYRMTFKQLDSCFQNWIFLISFHIKVIFLYKTGSNRSIFCQHCALWILMAWRFITSASVPAMVNTHRVFFSSFCVKVCDWTRFLFLLSLCCEWYHLK